MSYCPNRRRFVKVAALAVSAVYFPRLVGAAADGPRRLRFYHTHTSEKLDVTYYQDNAYVSEALDTINYLMRDFRCDETTKIDPALLDILHAASQRLGGRGTYEIISAYRSPTTNEMLRRHRGGVAKRSLHMQGKAIDVRLTDARTRDLRQVGLDLAQGGVGYYAKSDFVHLDTGRVRFW